jgi:hypothetical protein
LFKSWKEFFLQNTLQGEMGAPDGMIRAVANKHEGFPIHLRKNSFQDLNNGIIVLRMTQKRETDGRPDPAASHLLNKPIEFMTAEEMKGLHHRPGIALLSQLIKHLVGVSHLYVVPLLDPVLYHPGAVAPEELVIRKTLLTALVHVGIGFKRRGGGTKCGHDNGYLQGGPPSFVLEPISLLIVVP